MLIAATETRVVLQHWWDPEYRKSIVVKRRNMRVALKNYLHKTPLIAEVPGDLPDYVPSAFSLAESYRALVKAQHVPHQRGEPSREGAEFVLGALFAEIWNAATRMQLLSPEMPSSLRACATGAADDDRRVVGICAFAKSLPAGDVEDWLAQETIATANLLSEAYVKAFAESKAVRENKRDPIILKHHTTILFELVSDMLSLAVECAEPSDQRLPKAHFHHVTALVQSQTAHKPDSDIKD
jgi:hypothetical protein